MSELQFLNKVKRSRRPAYKGRGLLTAEHLRSFRPIDLHLLHCQVRGLLKETITFNPFTNTLDVSGHFAVSSTGNIKGWYKNYRLWAISQNHRSQLVMQGIFDDNFHDEYQQGLGFISFNFTHQDFIDELPFIPPIRSQYIDDINQVSLSRISVEQHLFASDEMNFFEKLFIKPARNWPSVLTRSELSEDLRLGKDATSAVFASRDVRVSVFENGDNKPMPVNLVVKTEDLETTDYTARKKLVLLGGMINTDIAGGTQRIWHHNRLAENAKELTGYPYLQFFRYHYTIRIKENKFDEVFEECIEQYVTNRPKEMNGYLGDYLTLGDRQELDRGLMNLEVEQLYEMWDNPKQVLSDILYQEDGLKEDLDILKLKKHDGITIPKNFPTNGYIIVPKGSRLVFYDYDRSSLIGASDNLQAFIRGMVEKTDNIKGNGLPTDSFYRAIFDPETPFATNTIPHAEYVKIRYADGREEFFLSWLFDNLMSSVRGIPKYKDKITGLHQYFQMNEIEVDFKIANTDNNPRHFRYKVQLPENWVDIIYDQRCRGHRVFDPRGLSDFGDSGFHPTTGYPMKKDRWQSPFYLNQVKAEEAHRYEYILLPTASAMGYHLKDPNYNWEEVIQNEWNYQNMRGAKSISRLPISDQSWNIVKLQPFLRAFMYQGKQSKSEYPYQLMDSSAHPLRFIVKDKIGYKFAHAFAMMKKDRLSHEITSKTLTSYLNMDNFNRYFYREDDVYNLYNMMYTTLSLREWLTQPTSGGSLYLAKVNELMEVTREANRETIDSLKDYPNTEWFMNPSFFLEDIQPLKPNKDALFHYPDLELLGFVSAMLTADKVVIKIGETNLRGATLPSEIRRTYEYDLRNKLIHTTTGFMHYVLNDITGEEGYAYRGDREEDYITLWNRGHQFYQRSSQPRTWLKGRMTGAMMNKPYDHIWSSFSPVWETEAHVRQFDDYSLKVKYEPRQEPNYNEDGEGELYSEWPDAATPPKWLPHYFKDFFKTLRRLYQINSTEGGLIPQPGESAAAVDITFEFIYRDYENRSNEHYRTSYTMKHYSLLSPDIIDEVDYDFTGMFSQFFVIDIGSYDNVINRLPTFINQYKG